MTVASLGYVDHEAVKARRRWALSRLAIYGTLALFALIYLFPALVLLSNAFRTALDVRLHGIIALPQSLSFDAWVRVWTRACVSGVCDGIAPNFYNSLRMVIPATIISPSDARFSSPPISSWSA